MAKDPSLLAENGRHIVLSKSWAHCLMIRMGLVKRTTSTKKSKDDKLRLFTTNSCLSRKIPSFAAINIPSSLVLDWYQTGINIVPSANYIYYGAEEDLT